MCGIVGLISGNKNGFTAKEVDTFRDMLFMDSLRGMDATGVMYGMPNGVVQMHKEASPAFKFMDSDQWKAAKSEIFGSGRWAVGHNRAATRGKKTDENAHPFVVSHKDDNDKTIFLVQNGTYNGSHDHLAKTEVDTEACAHIIVQEDDVSAAMKKINAAYVFVWYDTKDKTLNILRNDKRPLWIAQTKNGGVIFSSEAGILYAACWRNGLELQDKAYELKEGCHCQYKITYQGYDATFNTIDISYDYKNSPFPITGTTNTPHGFIPLRGPGGKPTIPTIPERSRIFTRRPGVLGLKDALLIVRDRYTPMRGAEILKALRESVAHHHISGTIFSVIGVDYVKVIETDVNDNQHYVFGQIVDSVDHVMEDELVCWIVDAPEKDVMHYVADNIFRMQLDYVVAAPYQSSNLTVIVADGNVRAYANAVIEEGAKDEASVH